MFSGLDGDHCKFADDDTLWHSGDQNQYLVEKICKDIDILKDWFRKWRMQISLPKQKSLCFYRLILITIQCNIKFIYVVGNTNSMTLAMNSYLPTDNQEPIVTEDNHVLQCNKTLNC